MSEKHHDVYMDEQTLKRGLKDGLRRRDAVDDDIVKV